MEANKRRSYQFGPFVLDAERQLLLREEEPVPITPKTHKTLLLLVESGGRILSKEELLRKLWPDGSVDESNLTQQISMVRKALGERPGVAQFVVTVPGRGYRFSSRVKALPNSTNEATAEHPARSSHSATEPGSVTERAGAPEPHRTAAGPSIVSRPSHTALVMTIALVVLGTLLTGFLSRVVRWRPPKAEVGVRSLAVLPFVVTNPGPEDAYLGVGMADVLITRLGGVHQVIVRPIESVRGYASATNDPLAVGRDLGVEMTIEGTIQRLGDRVRVTVRMLRVSDGSQLWSEQLDENFTDMFAVEDRISQRVTGALALKLTAEEQRTLAKRYTENSQAYQLYLQGRYFWNKRTVGALEEAIDYFQKAVDQDPSYALAYSGLADCYTLLGFYGGAPRGNMPKATAAAARALQLDDSLSEARTSLGGVKAVYDWDWQGAEREFRLALELNPNYALAHHWYAILVLAAQGRHSESIGEMQRAVDLDPVSPVIHTDLGWAYFLAGQQDEALTQYQKALDLDPAFLEAHDRLWRYYQNRNMTGEAIAEWIRMERVEGRTSSEVVEAAYQRGGYEAAITAMIACKRKAHETAYDLGVYYALAGRRQSALAALSQSLEQRDPGIIYLKVDPLLQGLRSDADFQSLLKKMGLA